MPQGKILVQQKVKKPYADTGLVKVNKPPYATEKDTVLAISLG